MQRRRRARYRAREIACGAGPLRPARYDSRVTDQPSSAKDSDLQTVFLDRDGVLNAKAPEGEYVTRWEDFKVLAGVPEALARLRRAGLRTLVVTNQRGIALGRYAVADVAQIHANFQAALASAGAKIDGFYVCPHNLGECNCRKPLPGLFEQAAADFPGITSATSVMIGDSLVDMEFGKRLGIQTILIDDRTEDRASDAEKARKIADACCASLSEAVNWILGPE
jgi:D-glycero-D-manno-heptose 1,7-bisphosphate phosphatase